MGVIIAVLIGVAAAQSFAADTLRIGGTGAALGLMKALGAGLAGRHSGLVVEVPKSLGSAGGIKALLAGALDLAVTSRPLKDEEREAGAQEILIGRTPLVFVTSRTDLEGNISSADVVALFGLAAHEWPDGAPAHIVMRPRSETDFDLLGRGITGMEAALERAWAQPGLPHAYSDQKNLDLAETLPGSLALSALATVILEKRRVAILSLDGAPGTTETLRRGSYRLARPFYLVSTTHPSALAAEFVAFVRGPRARGILLATGTLPAPQ